MVLDRTLTISLFILCLFSFSISFAQEKSIFSPKIIVNNSVITKFELDQRTKFITAIKFPGNPAELAQTQLIEERLKQKEAIKLNIIASDAEIEAALQRFASRVNLSANEFIANLRKIGIYSETFQSFVETEITWQKVIKKKFGEQSIISDVQLERSKSITKFEDTVQVLLTEIIIPFSNQDIREKEKLAQQLQNINTIEEFSNAARKYSKAPTANVGGRIKWQNFNTLPEIIKPKIFGLSPGEVSEPIRLSRAVALFQLRDIREKEDEKGRPDLLDFITINSKVSDVKSLEYIQNNFHNCIDVAGTIGNQTKVMFMRRKLFFEELPKALATVLETLDPNESTIVIDDEKAELVILCERNQQEKPSMKTIENEKKFLQNTRLKYLARSFLETLKDDARIVIK